MYRHPRSIISGDLGDSARRAEIEKYYLDHDQDVFAAADWAGIPVSQADLIDVAHADRAGHGFVFADWGDRPHGLDPATALRMVTGGRCAAFVNAPRFVEVFGKPGAEAGGVEFVAYPSILTLEDAEDIESLVEMGWSVSLTIPDGTDAMRLSLTRTHCHEEAWARHIVGLPLADTRTYDRDLADLLSESEPYGDAGGQMFAFVGPLLGDELLALLAWSGWEMIDAENGYLRVQLNHRGETFVTKE